MSLKNKIVVVTGGAGFVGSHLVDALQKEEPEEIVVLDIYTNGLNSNLNGKLGPEHKTFVNPIDVCDFNRMKKMFESAQPDVVFNLAVSPLPRSLVQPVETYRDNVEMGITICELARMDLFKTLIHFSSSEVYGTCVTSPMREDHPLNGRTTYAASKAAVDQLVLAYHHTFGIDASIIRPFNIYGPRQNDRGYAAVIPITIRRILAGKKPIICGDGNQTRDYSYVTDIANAAIDTYMFNCTRGKIINVASGNEISIYYLVKKICEIMEYTGDVEFRQERVGDVRRHIADISLAKETILYRPSVTFGEGIRKTVEWYRRNT